MREILGVGEPTQTIVSDCLTYHQQTERDAFWGHWFDDGTWEVRHVTRDGNDTSYNFAWRVYDESKLVVSTLIPSYSPC